MQCPKCKADTRVTETRPVKGNMLRRRRICAAEKCDKRFTTIETIVDTNANNADAHVLVLPRSVINGLRVAFSLIGKYVDLHNPDGLARSDEHRYQKPRKEDEPAKLDELAVASEHVDQKPDDSGE